MDPVHERACTRIFSLLNGFLSARVLVTLIAFAPGTACKSSLVHQDPLEPARLCLGALLGRSAWNLWNQKKRSNCRWEVLSFAANDVY